VGPGGLKVRAPGRNLSKGPQLICDATARKTKIGTEVAHVTRD